MRPSILCLLLAPLALRADGLATLREHLSRLPGTTAVKGSLDLQTWNRGGKGKEQEETQGSGSVWLEDGPQGLRQAWSRSLVQALDQEAQKAEREPKAKHPLGTALGALNPSLLLQHVNAAPGLLRVLERAKVLEEKREAWNGQPATRLTLEPSLKPMTEEDRKRVKKYEARLVVWVGEHGLPLATQETTSVKASMMLMSIENQGEVASTYVRIGDRLVMTRHERKEHNTLPIVGELQSRTITSFSAQ